MNTTSEPQAHTPGPAGTWHSLEEHLTTTAGRAKARAEKFGGGDLAYLAGLVHDVGKYNPAFQERLLALHEGRHADPVKHAVYGALLALEIEAPHLVQPIYGHHSGMPSRARLQEAIADPEVQEAWRGFRNLVPEVEARPGSAPGGNRLQQEMLVRMLFSALVDADYLDTEAHFSPDKVGVRGVGRVRLADLWVTLQQAQERLAAPPSVVNEVRREVYECCVGAADGPQGIYRLAVPTGGGKTRSAAAFALRHAVENGLERVITAVPFTSITDQTASVYREVFGDEAVLEHHSAIQARVTESNKLATQNWDAPLIVTTTVQLLESLLSNRPSKCRKLHNIANSVIILDEVQSLPVHLLEPITDVLEELVRRYGCSVVLSTATQPPLRWGGDIHDIIPPRLSEGHFERLRRVQYELPTSPWSWARVGEEMAAQRSVMAVVNSKRDAIELLDCLGEEGALHLSTLLCGAHRMSVLSEVRRLLDAGEDCKLVATQIVEAGVDISFPTVLRAMGPLSSIIQAAGRCNREAELEGLGRVVVFEPSEGHLPYGHYRTATDICRVMLERYGPRALEDNTLVEAYFNTLYHSSNRDANGIQALRRELDYPAVAEEFRLIEDQQVDVIIPYNQKAQGIIERIRRERELQPGDHRRLQPYVVGVYPAQFQKAANQRMEIAEGVWVWTDVYDEVRGIVLNDAD